MKAVAPLSDAVVLKTEIFDRFDGDDRALIWFGGMAAKPLIEDAADAAEEGLTASFVLMHRKKQSTPATCPSSPDRPAAPKS